MTFVIPEFLRTRAVTRTTPSPADVCSFRSPSAPCNKTSATQQSFKTPHNPPKHALPFFCTIQIHSTVLTSLAETLVSLLSNIFPIQAATGDGEDPRLVASSQQRATSSAEEADPTLAAQSLGQTGQIQPIQSPCLITALCFSLFEDKNPRLQPMRSTSPSYCPSR